MNSTIKRALIFVVGAVVGAASTYHFVRKYFEEKANMEIQQVMDQKAAEPVYEGEAEISEANPVITEEPEAAEEEVSDEVYLSAMARYSRRDRPYIISPDTVDDAERLAVLSYYANGYLIDEYNEPVEDADDVVGLENLNHMGEEGAGPDEVYIRNDRLDQDYCVIRVLGHWDSGD